MKKRALFINHQYYIDHYLSLELRKLGWKADTLNTSNGTFDYLSHGEDFRFHPHKSASEMARLHAFLLKAMFEYDVFVFANSFFTYFLGQYPKMLKLLGKKIVYVTSGCNDGCLRTTFNKAFDHICDKHCGWPVSSCGDAYIAKIAKERNKYSDLVYAADPFMADYNSADHVEPPIYFCINKELWRPGLEIPPEHKLTMPPDAFKIFHSMANLQDRKHGGKNFKGSPEIVNVVERLKAKGHKIEMVFKTGLKNLDIRYYMEQADVVIDQIHYGWFGAQAREALALGKPVVSYIRPEWREKMEKAFPGYHLPIVSANAETLEETLEKFIADRVFLDKIGRESRDFAEKWIDCAPVAKILDEQWTRILFGSPPKR